MRAQIALKEMIEILVAVLFLITLITSISRYQGNDLYYLSYSATKMRATINEMIVYYDRGLLVSFDLKNKFSARVENDEIELKLKSNSVSTVFNPISSEYGKTLFEKRFSDEYFSGDRPLSFDDNELTFEDFEFDSLLKIENFDLNLENLKKSCGKNVSVVVASDFFNYKSTAIINFLENLKRKAESLCGKNGFNLISVMKNDDFDTFLNLYSLEKIEIIENKMIFLLLDI